MRPKVRKKLAILNYLYHKLPEGWELHDYMMREDFDDVFSVYKHLADQQCYFITVAIREDPNNAAQQALHSTWGYEEMSEE